MADGQSEASLHALVDKAHAAFNKSRWARAADLFKRAALQVSSLYPHDSLVVVDLQYHGADSLQAQSKQPGVSVADQRVLQEESWALVRQGIEVMSRRHVSDTLGYNKCRLDEVQYATRRMISQMPIFARSHASALGVSTAIRLARLCLYRLHCRSFGIPLPPLAASERGVAEQFVLRSLDNLASARAVTIRILDEAELVFAVQQLLASSVMEPPAMEPSFRAALDARWTSPDVMAGIRLRGTMEESLTRVSNANAESEADQRADVAEHGLLLCALPGCGKIEVTVREFKVCSACRAAAYCSAEHGGLHWARGHKHECKDLKAAGAKPARAV